jgi:hypothetical protein
MVNIHFCVWCLGGVNVLPQNVVDPPLGDTKITTKVLEPISKIGFWFKIAARPSF